MITQEQIGLLEGVVKRSSAAQHCVYEDERAALRALLREREELTAKLDALSHIGREHTRLELSPGHYYVGMDGKQRCQSCLLEWPCPSTQIESKLAEAQREIEQLKRDNATVLREHLKWKDLAEKRSSYGMGMELQGEGCSRVEYKAMRARIRELEAQLQAKTLEYETERQDHMASEAQLQADDDGTRCRCPKPVPPAAPEPERCYCARGNREDGTRAWHTYGRSGTIYVCANQDPEPPAAEPKCCDGSFGCSKCDPEEQDGEE